MAHWRVLVFAAGRQPASGHAQPFARRRARLDGLDWASGAACGGVQRARSVRFGPAAVHVVEDPCIAERWYGLDGDADSEPEELDEFGCCPAQVAEEDRRHGDEQAACGLPCAPHPPYDICGGFLGFQPRGVVAAPLGGGLGGPG